MYHELAMRQASGPQMCSAESDSTFPITMIHLYKQEACALG
jgi:hypothetical protein